MNTPTAFDGVVRLEGISVRYTRPTERIETLKEYAIRRLKRGVRFDQFWALRGVSLELGQGESLGVIGPNGAGKTTMLKVIARVLRPTEGRVRVRGNVAPLLEFGAGFHPELTGRENIFLNGALLGFTRREMEAKYGRIVAFSEMAEFIDAPLRTYSSGMVARLGFAVASDVTPDVLLLDEVLAVGDESFRRKSAARMNEFKAQGATLILVTHSMQNVVDMCQRALWLDRGQVRALGPAPEVTAAYVQAAK